MQGLQARTRHEIFENYAKQGFNLSFRDFMAGYWRRTIQQYDANGWKMIPIIVRGKLPLRAAGNYESHAAQGPFLPVDEALSWVTKGFNLAVAAGPSGIVWCDIDDPQFLQPWMNIYALMRTPRGYAMPIKQQDGLTLPPSLKKKGLDFREDVAYELVPVSETCTKDHALHGVKHPGPREPCLDGKPHDYRVREWVNLPNRVVTLEEFIHLAT